jgi:hypothetical protein
MAITHPTAMRTTLAAAIVTAIGSTGKLKILTSGDSVLGTITLGATSHSNSNGVLTLSGVPLTANATGDGTAAKFTVTKSDDTVIYQGTVGTSGADLTIVNTSILTGQPLTVTAHTYTAPA